MIELVAPPEAIAPSVIATWRGRMINEHGSSFVFDQLADRFAELGLAEATEARAFADEERHHGRLCGTVVAAAGGSTATDPAHAKPLPRHADTTPRAAIARNVISICCMNETVAVALIGAERLEMAETNPLHALLTAIWSDEIGHARFGWRYVSSAIPALDAAERAAVIAYLPTAFRALEDHQIAHIPLATWAPEAAAYGLCDGADARTLFYETVTDVIVPQLDALGLDASRAWETRRAP